MSFEADEGKTICLEGGEHRFHINVYQVLVIMSICASLLSMWLLKPLERPFSYQALHGGILVASTAASQRTNEMLKILLEGVIVKLHVFMYVCVCLFIFHCGKSKYLAVFSQGSSVNAVLTFMQKVTVPKGWCRRWQLRTSISSRLYQLFIHLELTTSSICFSCSSFTCLL